MNLDMTDFLNSFFTAIRSSDHNMIGSSLTLILFIPGPVHWWKQGFLLHDWLH